MSKKSINNHERFRDGIMKLNGNQFGMVGEIVVETLMGYTRSKTLKYDLTDLDGKRVEVKAAKVQEGGNVKVTVDNFYDVAMDYAKWERLLTRRKVLGGKALFACNIQRVKPHLFDRLVYLLFFKNQVEIFAMDGDDLDPDNPDMGYSYAPFGGNPNEGLLRIDGKTYRYHRFNHFKQSISYDDLMKAAKAKRFTG